eukprot:8893702-Karenia_brevis.AAC.1
MIGNALLWVACLLKPEFFPVNFLGEPLQQLGFVGSYFDLSILPWHVIILHMAWVTDLAKL